MSTKSILLDHGSGGVASRNLIEEIFLPRLDNPILSQFEDSAILQSGSCRFWPSAFAVFSLVGGEGDR